MLVLDKSCECWEIAHNDRYIATIGKGVAIWDRGTLEPVYHFTGMRWIHSGIFVNDDVLMVYTGEQKLFFLQISQKKVLWVVPRPRELASYGDIRCCHVPGNNKVFCIAQGKKSLDEHFLLIVDWTSQELSIRRVADCYRVVSCFVWTQKLGLSFLSYQAKGDNETLLYRIFQVDNAGNSSIIYDEESKLHVLAYSGNHLFMGDFSSQMPQANVYPLERSTARDRLKLGKPLRIPLTPLQVNSPFSGNRLVLPQICWIDENAGLLVACNQLKWVGVYDFLNEKKIIELHNSTVYYGKLLDSRLLMGCTSGFCVEPINW